MTYGPVPLKRLKLLRENEATDRKYTVRESTRKLYMYFPAHKIDSFFPAIFFLVVKPLARNSIQMAK